MPEWDKKNVVAAAVGAACAAAVGVFLGRRWFGGDDRDPDHAPALMQRRPAGPVGHSGSARSAGPEAMRDPPTHWDAVDEASDESFPASDPPNLSKHVD